MIADSLISAAIRDISQHMLRFGESEINPQLPPQPPDRPILLYLHVPFCVVLCPFCFFHRVEFKRDRTQKYFAALRKEIQWATDVGFRFDELYVGGGTPTVMPDELLETVNLLRELQPIRQMSAETNPDDLDDSRLLQLRDAGINRLSVGVQSFDDTLLKQMGRYEKYGSGAQIVQRLQAIDGDFDTLNVDMIFNLPRQSETSLLRDLRILTDVLGIDQVSFYPLMTANNTRQPLQRAMGVVDDRSEGAMYRIIVDHLLANGYRRSSAWCFSRRGDMIDEYVSERDEYLGLGSGAFSYLGGSIYSSTFSINHYLKLIGEGRSGIVRKRNFSRSDQMRYFLLMRLFGGSLDLDEADQKFCDDFRLSMRAELAGLRLLGAVRQQDRMLHLTERGYYLWVMMMREFFTGVNNFREEMRHDISGELGTLRTGS